MTDTQKIRQSLEADVLDLKLSGEDNPELMARKWLSQLCDELDEARAENARLEAEKQASMDTEEILAATLVREELLLSKQAQLEAENAKLREALQRSLLFAEAVSTGREDGDDYAASDLARDLRDLIAGGE